MYKESFVFIATFICTTTLVNIILKKYIHKYYANIAHIYITMIRKLILVIV